MRQRAADIKGKLKVKTAPGGGSEDWVGGGGVRQYHFYSHPLNSADTSIIIAAPINSKISF